MDIRKMKPRDGYELRSFSGYIQSPTINRSASGQSYEDQKISFKSDYPMKIIGVYAKQAITYPTAQAYIDNARFSLSMTENMDVGGLTAYADDLLNMSTLSTDNIFLNSFYYNGVYCNADKWAFKPLGDQLVSTLWFKGYYNEAQGKDYVTSSGQPYTLFWYYSFIVEIKNTRGQRR